MSVDMRIVGGPDHMVGADRAGNPGNTSLVYIGGDPASFTENFAGLSRHPGGETEQFKLAVGAVHPSGHPSAPGLQNDVFELGKAVEDVALEDAVDPHDRILGQLHKME